MSTHAAVQKRQHEESAPQHAGLGKPSQAARVGLPLFMQAKLTIGASDDLLEQEADQVADEVLATSLNPAVSVVPPRLQRLTQQTTGGMDTVPASVDRVLASSGRPMEPALRQDMEQRFDHDFSRVRVHSGAAAEQSARDVNANAYTVGHNIVFGEGRFSLATNEGRRLIAHELTHVVQQSGRAVTADTSSGEPRSPSMESRGRGHQKLQRDAVELGPQFNRALMMSDWEMAARALAEMSDRDAWMALSALQSSSRAQIREAVLRLDSAPGNHIALVIDSIERGPATRSDPSPVPVTTTPAEMQATDIASLGATEKISRAWGFASERLGPDIRREIENLFSPASITAMAAFAALYIASQLTPAGWVADALVLIMLTATVIFVGMLAIEIARDIWRYFAAINASNEADLRAAGEALSRAIARGGVALFIALLSRARPRGGPPAAGPTAEAVAISPEGLRVPVRVNVVQEVPAAIPRHLQRISYAVMVPPPGGRGASSQDSASAGASTGRGPPPQSGGSRRVGPSSGPIRGLEIWDELSRELNLEPPGTGAARGGGVRGAIEDARAGGLIGPAGSPGTADLGLQPHGSASTARSTLGVTGAEANSAHVAPTAAVRGVSGYSRSGALTTLLDPATHLAFDAHWKNWAMAQRRTGRTTCSIAELERVMLDAIDQTPGLAQRTKNTLAWRLQMELRELGLQPDSTVELPYRNIGPSSGP